MTPTRTDAAPSCMSVNMSSVLSLSSHFHGRILPSLLSIPSRLRPPALRLLRLRLLRSTPTGLSLSLHNSERRSSLRTLTIAASGSSPSPAPKMVKAIRVLKWEDVEVGEPKEGEIRVRNKAIGVNFIDAYYRKGVYAKETPFTPGMEAVGVVTAVGPGLTDRQVEAGHTVLIHAAAGGVGSLLCQWANALGATVIGTVSTEEKAAQAAEDGCHHVIVYTKEDFVARVGEVTSGNGVNVVYDSVGKDTFQGSLSCLRSRGFMVSFGQSSGRPDPVPLSDLASKSLFLTRPSLMHYTATRDELLAAAGEVFDNVAAGILRVRVNHIYPLSDAARAHADLEARKTSGSIVLIP
ncbi:Zinc-binding dehydrogenase [Musa troglodytarum]|uniref:Probable quinone oxidoreductase n=1 Tax=Musa troglodytarum TaxID=320322 RepID=A0A9E7KUV0_9LILI|nr:Zinc-binding dehydrogenase [Musa troglodytarum]